MSKRRPLIGIPCSVYPDPAPGLTPAHGVARSYLHAVEAAGGVPLLLNLTRDSAALDALYRLCDGLLFAGGVDLSPDCYGAAPHPKLGPTDPLQDAVELGLARRAWAERRPILGICRGMQLLNVALGGTLYQDIASELPGALNHLESFERGGMGHLAHPLVLEPDSWLAGWLDAAELPVNTVHHQGLRVVAAGLRVVGRAPDGLPEAVEGNGPGFLAAVQCHPEELCEAADRRWERVFAAFVSVAGAGG
ncbi:MAG: gamma-glutamyl-gamma-aminobutyrate hydrolase family protein [Roseiflexaceae bacterium]